MIATIAIPLILATATPDMPKDRAHRGENHKQHHTMLDHIFHRKHKSAGHHHHGNRSKRTNCGEGKGEKHGHGRH